MEEQKQEKIPVKKRSLLSMIIVILLLLFIAIQFFQPMKNNNDVDHINDISSVVEFPDSVRSILKTACYDCHSNNTEYPWYTNIQPVAWWLNDHVSEGKWHLNFDEFATIPPRNGKSTEELQLKKLEEIKETVELGDMPLTSYTWMHSEAKLNKDQKQIIYNWVDSSKIHLARPSSK